MNISSHPHVVHDLRSVMAYDSTESGLELASEFYREFERAVTALSENPLRFHPCGGNLRRANLKRFPYHLLDRFTGDHVRILTVRHHRRHPRVDADRT